MQPTRRAVLAGTPSFIGALAGCDVLGGQRQRGSGDTSDRVAGEATGDAASGQGDQTGVGETDGTGGSTDESANLADVTIDVRNAGRSTEYVSIAVHAGGRIVASRTVEVRAGSIHEATMRLPAEVLELELETVSGRTATHPLVVGDAMGELSITLTGTGIRFAQRAWCSPECSPLSTGGTAADFPYADGPVSPKSAGSNVFVENASGRQQSVTVQIRHDGTPILRYGYEIPVDVTLELPAVRSAGEYTVSVTADAGTHSTDWTPSKQHRLQVRLTDDGVESSCGRTTATFVLRNDDSIVHRVSVAAYRPGEDRPRFHRSFIVQPDARYRVPAAFEGSGQYELRVDTSDGAQTTADWWLCPPRGPTEIIVHDEGDVGIVELTRASE